MILEKETKEKFGYEVASLSSGSNHSIMVRCDYCQEQYDTSMKRLNIGRKKFPKDCCYGCRKHKREEMSLLKYGVKNPFQRNEIKEKMKETCLEKYGVEFASQAESTKERFRETMLERYGAENPAQCPEIRAKQIETMKKNYGVEFVSQSPEIVEKIKKTNLERYGHEWYIGSKACRDKAKEKFGVDNVFQLEEVKEKIVQHNMEKYGVTHPMQDPEICKERHEKGFNTKVDTGLIKLYDKKKVSEWADDLGFSRSHFNTLVNKFGWEKAVKMTPRISSLEEKFRHFLIDKNIEFEQQTKISNYFADFTIGNIAIELSGLWWHSEYHKDKYYHLVKREIYANLGYSSLFFFQDEINDKFPIIESIVLNKLGLSKKIFARKCSMAHVDKETAKQFYETNHLMGKGRGDSIGLFYNGELITCFQYKRINKNEYELSRFASRMGYSVVGGFTKLLKLFEQEMKPDSFTTFIDLRYGSGEYLTKFGFSQESNDLSFDWTDGHVRYNRTKFTGNTGYDFGFLKIWDCGQAKYKKVYNP